MSVYPPHPSYCYALMTNTVQVCSLSLNGEWHWCSRSAFSRNGASPGILARIPRIHWVNWTLVSILVVERTIARIIWLLEAFYCVCRNWAEQIIVHSQSRGKTAMPLLQALSLRHANPKIMQLSSKLRLPGCLRCSSRHIMGKSRRGALVVHANELNKWCVRVVACKHLGLLGGCWP